MPEGWAWCRLGEISIVKSSKRVFEKDYVPAGIPFYRSLEIGQLYRNEILSQTLYITKEHYEELKRNYGVPSSGDILITSVGSIGNTWICDDREFYYKDGNVTQISKSALFDSSYMNYFLHSDLMNKQITDTVGGSAYNALTIEKLKNLIIPLPPPNEQQQIVKTIAKIFSQIESIDNNKSELDITIKQAKSKILDLAIHGKLVPQDSNDEPAEELLKRIATSDNRPYEKVEEDSIPFEIPTSWLWTTIKNIVNYIGDGDWIESKDQFYHFVSDKGIRLIQTGNIGFGTFKDKEGKYHYISENTFNSLGCNEIFEGDILISRLPEPVGRACILPKLPERMITAVDCTIIRLNEDLFQKELFVYYTISNKYLELIKENCTGTTRLRISRSNLEKILVPIPPLKEQKRILNRIKELFALLDEIVLNLV